MSNYQWSTGMIHTFDDYERIQKEHAQCLGILILKQQLDHDAIAALEQICIRMQQTLEQLLALLEFPLEQAPEA